MYPAAFNNVISVGAIDEEGLIRDLETSIEFCDYYTVKAEIMMTDFKSYEKYINMNDISDEQWNTFCEEFADCAGGCVSLTKEIHYFRNKLNRAPATLNELLAEKDKWELLPVGE